MGEIKLSDQLGAMAIVDELYQNQAVLMEHLNQETLRQSIADKIKEYYQSKGLDVNNEMIEEGVRLWYDRRLRFEVPKKSWLQQKLATLYISSSFWLKILFAIIFALLLFLLFIGYTQNYKKRVIEEELTAKNQQFSSVSEQFSGLKQQYLELSRKPVRYAIKPVEEIKDQVDQQLGVVDFDTMIKPSAKINSLSFEQKKAKIAEQEKQNTLLQEQADAISQRIEKWHSIMSNDTELSRLADDKKFTSALNEYPALRRSFNEAISVLSQGNQEPNINIIKELYQTAGKTQQISAESERIVNQIRLKRVPENQMQVVYDSQKALNNELNNLNIAAAQEHLNRLAYYATLADTSLILKIVDRVGQSSGIERTFNDSNGKAWYLIVEAITPTGNVLPMVVTSNEEGQSKTVSTFGIRIEKQEFDKVRNDKMNDGHIDNPVVGEKPVGHLMFSYSRPVKGGYITEW